MSCLLISDDIERSAPVANRLSRAFPVNLVPLSGFSEDNDQGALFFLVDIDFSNKKSIEQFRARVQSSLPTKEKIFVIRKEFPAEVYRANALGAVATLPSDFDKLDVLKILRRYATPITKNKRHVAPETTRYAIESIKSLNADIYQAVSSNRPLPKAQVISSCDQIIESLKNDAIGAWLEAVSRHNSYTYRHCMTVSGIAVAFAMHLGMQRSDVQRIALGALMHDIGKVRIPLSILDKPGKLSSAERAEINKHPGYGADILRKDGQFDDEVVEIAHYHHELLDGTGYPEGLTGDQISDPVRIITIVDIFSALIDKRSYKDSISAEKAYRILSDMGGKLDRDILKAFEPVTRAVGSGAQHVAMQQTTVAS